MAKHKKDVTSGLKGRLQAQMGQSETAAITPVLVPSGVTSSVAPLPDNKPMVPANVSPSPSASGNASAAHLFVRSPVRKMLISELRVDNGLQSRVKLHVDVAGDYAEALDRGDQFPPIVAYYDNDDYWVADGFHRIEAHRIIERLEIAVEVRQGTRHEAFLFSLGPANRAHGLRRSAADKRHAIEMVLAEPLWSGKSDRWLADICCVADKTVAAVRRALQHKQPEQKDAKSIPRQGRDGKVRQQPVRKPLAADQIPEVVPAVPASDDRDTSYRASPSGSLADIGLRDSPQRVEGVAVIPPAVRASLPITDAQRQLQAALATTMDSLDYLATSLPEDAKSADLRGWIHQGRIFLNLYTDKE